MHFSEKRARLFGALRECLKLEHFVIHFNWRDAQLEEGAGFRGVRNFGLLQAYAEGLERMYTVMRQLGFQPTVDDSGKTHVYLSHLFETVPGEPRTQGRPFVGCDLDGVPYIGLPSRSHEPGIHDAMERSRLEAAHEAFHVFTASKGMRLSRQAIRDAREALAQESETWEAAWRWMDEASATYFEHVCYPGNDDRLRFCMNWIDLPEIPMDRVDYAYEGAMFLRYMDRRFTDITNFPGRFVMSVWKEAEAMELPLHALSRLADPAGHSEIERLSFFEDFCTDSYFIGDPASPGFAYDVAARFGTPTLSRHSPVENLSGGSITGAVDHLGCRYYRFADLAPATRAQFVLRARDPRKASYLGASASLCGRHLRRMLTKPFESRETELVVELTPGELRDARSIIITVSNSALSADQDGAPFHLTANLARTQSSPAV